MQKEVAQTLGVNPWTLGNWENGYTEPVIVHYPAIMAFLGYCPWMPADTLGKQIYRCRVHQGLSIQKFARQLEVDPATVSRWEAGDRKPMKRMIAKLWQLFGAGCISDPQTPGTVGCTGNSGRVNSDLWFDGVER